MGIFDWLFKKQTPQPDYDPLNIKITDLKKGFVFDYDMKSWIIRQVFEYDWGNNYFTREYKVDSGDDVAFLSVEVEDEYTITFTRKVKPRQIDEDLPEYIIEHNYPPKKLFYKNKKFFRESETPGYFRDLGKPGSRLMEVISWEYYDADQKEVIFVEQWGEREFDAAYGKVLKEFEISNILPNSSDL